MRAIAISYLEQVRTQATALYEQAKQYVTAAPVNETVPYQGTRRSGEKVTLSGQALMDAKRYARISNEEQQYQRINHVVMTGIAGLVYHYALWTHSLFLTATVLPVAYIAHKKVNQLIVSYFAPQKLESRNAIGREIDPNRAYER